MFILTLVYTLTVGGIDIHIKGYYTQPSLRMCETKRYELDQKFKNRMLDELITNVSTKCYISA